LFLLLAMFIGCVYFIAYPGAPGQGGVRIQDAVPPSSVRD
jgi:hypothetical protein